MGEIFWQMDKGWKSTSRIVYSSLISGRTRFRRPLLIASLNRSARVGAWDMPRRWVSREFLFFFASSISTSAPRDLEVLMTGIARAERRTKDAALVRSA